MKDVIDMLYASAVFALDFCRTPRSALKNLLASATPTNTATHQLVLLVVGAGGWAYLIRFALVGIVPLIGIPKDREPAVVQAFFGKEIEWEFVPVILLTLVLGLGLATYVLAQVGARLIAAGNQTLAAPAPSLRAVLNATFAVSVLFLPVGMLAVWLVVAVSFADTAAASVIVIAVSGAIGFAALVYLALAVSAIAPASGALATFFGLLEGITFVAFWLWLNRGVIFK